MKRNYINIITKLTVAVAAVVSISSCKEEGGLAPEYMPDMYRSPSIETYVDFGELRGKQGDEKLINKSNALEPVEGTIARGYMPYAYNNTPEDYELAGQNLKNPIGYSEDVVSEGKELYGMFCVHCHGDKGQGDGTLVQRDKFPPIPTKFGPALELAEGKMFHTITYGKGLMGSHSSQLNQEERWKLVHYIRASFMGKAPAADTSAAVEPVVEEKMEETPVEATEEENTETEH
jgi:mono/diheme cytochrome c family protein